MLGRVTNIFKIPDLRNKILFTAALLTVALLCIYRIGFHKSIPCFDQAKVAQMMEGRSVDSPIGRVAENLLNSIRDMEECSEE